MKTMLEELWARFKTLAWSAFWVGLVFLVDNLSQIFAGVSLPDVRTTLFGVLNQEIVVNMNVVVGLAINQISKFVHNYRVGKVYEF